MSEWSNDDRDDDLRLTRALARGDIDALTHLYDAYAPRLHDYCHALLPDQGAASTALHDTFLAARVHAGRLADPHLLRAWLYALARVVCLRLRRACDREGRRPRRGWIADPLTGEARPMEPAPEADDAFLDEEDRLRRLETRKLVHGALSGLQSREREAVDLLVRHGMSPAELAGVLGLDDATAAELAVSARTALEDALRVPAVAEFGRCPEVTATVTGKRRPLDPEVVQSVERHMAEGCRICEQDRSRLAAATLLRTLPAALVPAELRARVLRAATDPAGEQARLAAARNVEPLDEWGWPLPEGTPVLRPGDAEPPRRPRRVLPVLAVTAAVATVLGGVFWLLPGGREPLAGGARPAPPMLADSDAPSDAPAPSASSVFSPTPGPSSPSASPTTPSASPSTASPTPTAGPTATTRPQPPQQTQPPQPPQPPQGSLQVSGCQMGRGQRSCTIRITAMGGAVDWRVTGTQGPINVAGGGGRLAPGQTETLTVSRRGGCDEDESGTVFFSPNGAAGVSWKCYWWE
ncbi:RNA polymerase sigma factor [Thermomonospora catenispora]|uniref:RNA polymerase sigma factor n=1 Tax=Thermomonospora catenispora TaxID=2493090 RepID=UPI0011222385|nr:sigma-70 family RNA polymerase sigma factor [Thermomonospora catenispora]TNY36858.1 sigma-70 family RNA polymerase sigma factor [Thermomonospora catenispora]